VIILKDNFFIIILFFEKQTDYIKTQELCETKHQMCLTPYPQNYKKSTLSQHQQYTEAVLIKDGAIIDYLVS